MGRDTYLYVFIGRKCTPDEVKNIEQQIESKENESHRNDYFDYAHISMHDSDDDMDGADPFVTIDGYPAVLIFNHKSGDQWYICEKLIGSYDLEHSDNGFELGLGGWKSTNKTHHLMLVPDISY